MTMFNRFHFLSRDLYPSQSPESKQSRAAQALAGQRHPSALKNGDTVKAAADLALAYQSEGKFSDSEALAREAAEFYQKERPDDWQGFLADSLLEPAWPARRNTPKAEPLLLQGYQGMLQRKERMTAADRYYLELPRMDFRTLSGPG